MFDQAIRVHEILAYQAVIEPHNGHRALGNTHGPEIYEIILDFV